MEATDEAEGDPGFAPGSSRLGDTSGADERVHALRQTVVGSVACGQGHVQAGACQLAIANPPGGSRAPRPASVHLKWAPSLSSTPTAHRERFGGRDEAHTR